MRARIRFLFELYEVEFWWFELFEMMRKLSMTSVLVFVPVGSLGQILVGLIVRSYSPPISHTGPRSLIAN